jgi:hypothetical protein
MLHTHFSWVGALQAFLAVVIVGTLWKLTAMHLMATDNDVLNHVGKGMAFQYS